MNLETDLSLVGSTRVNGKIDPPFKIEEFLVQSRVPGEATVYFSDVVLDAREAELTYFTYDFCAISPDIPSPFALALNYHFEKEIPPYTDIILELPAAVDVPSSAGLCFIQPPKKENVERKGKPYVRWTFRREGPGPHHARRGKGIKDIRFYLRTERESGVLDGYYFLRYGKVETEPKRIKLPIIRIPKTTAPERFITDMDLATFAREPLKTWPGAVSNVKRLGMNTVMLAMTKQTSPQAVEELKRKAEVYQNAGLEVMSRPGGWTVGCHLLTDPDSRAKDINGHSLKNRPCYSQRKKGFMKAVANGKGIIDAGVYKIQFDDEFPLVCFCPACCRRFQKFLKECERSLSYVAPVIFEKKAKKYPELHQAWIKFGLWNYAQAILDFRKELEAHMRAKGLDPELLVLGDDAHTIIDNPHAIAAYEKAFDWHGEQIYITEYGQFKGNPWLAGERVAKIKDKLKNSRLKVVPTLTTGQTEFSGAAADLRPPKLMFYQILESFVAGADGVHIYDYGDIDLMEMKYMAEANRIIGLVEEVVLDGRPLNAVRIVKGAANLRSVGRKNEAILLFSQYDLRRLPQQITCAVLLKGKVNLIDLESREIIKISPRQKSFEVTLDKEHRVVMFRLVSDICLFPMATSH